MEEMKTKSFCEAQATDAKTFQIYHEKTLEQKNNLSILNINLKM
jgi:hypothetical protein